MSRLADLDRASRERPLTPAESCQLENDLCCAEGRAVSSGLRRELARAGIKRSGRRIPA